MNHSPSSSAPSRAAVPLWWTALRDVAAQDWLLATHLVILLEASLLGSGPRRSQAIAATAADIAIFSVLVLTARSRLLGPRLSAVTYRAALFVAILGSFLQLHWILPTATPHVMDADLLRVDLALFGVEPALALDALITPARTEWFSFFYFGYFPFLLTCVATAMFFVRDRHKLAEFSFGFVWLFTVGHSLYLLVPGHGPYIHLASSFRNSLEGATFWPLVRETVESVEISARTDVFPSLHTAVPMFVTTFLFHNRQSRVLRALLVPCALFASQVMIATMYLRWHYAIDVVAGIAHAVLAAWLGRRVARDEASLRERLGCAPVWSTPW